MKISSKGNSPSRWTLVQWLSGDSTGKYDIIKLSWVRDFTEDDVGNHDESHIVEWRVPPQPKDGWHLYDAKVLKVSDDLEELQSKKFKLSDDSEDSDHDSSEESLYGGHSKGKTPKSGHSEGGTPKSGSSMSETPKLQPRTSNASTPNVQALLGQLLAAVGQEISPGNLKNPAQILGEDCVKIGKFLSLPRGILLEAKGARSGTHMTKILVSNAFTVERRIKSTYAGQRRTRNGAVTQKPGLKRYQKMEDIQDFVFSRFPSLSQSAFSGAVNDCLGKKAQHRQPIQLVEESEEEMDC